MDSSKKGKRHVRNTGLYQLKHPVGIGCLPALVHPPRSREGSLQFAICSLLLNRKIGSRRSSIVPEFVNCSVQIYNGKTPVRCKITEGKVGHQFGEFAFTRKRRRKRTKIGPGRKRGKSKV